jgi:hypothetical protein
LIFLEGLPRRGARGTGSNDRRFAMVAKAGCDRVRRPGPVWRDGLANGKIVATL